MIVRLPQADRSAIGLLKLLLVASLLIPALLFAVAAWFNYESALGAAERELLRSSEVAREQASKIFDAESQVADRVNDAITKLDAQAIVDAERTFHDMFLAIIARLPQVQSVLLADRSGRALASAGTYPVPRNVDLRSRDYFKAVMGGHDGPFISRVQVGDINQQPFFGLSRGWTGADGQLKGVIDVAVSPKFFEDFYAILIGEGLDGTEGKVVSLLRDDGDYLARYPPLPGPSPMPATNAGFLAAIRKNPDYGTYESRSIIDAGRVKRVYAYRHVQGYPVYVLAGRDRSSIMDGWRRSMASHLIFGIPVTLALFAVTWTALVRTRREKQALDHAHLEIERRQRAESALLKAQRLEAVGQMTGGVAHDFNNLLTVILGSAELLQRRAEDPGRVRGIAQNIVMAAQHGGKVTQQLLTFSRRQLVHPEPLDLDALLRAFEPMLERAASEAIQLEFALAAGSHTVLLDPGHCEAAVLNLVGNARDAMADGGCIRISTSLAQLTAAEVPDLPAGNYIRLAVTDNGTGMDAETVAKAFEPFFTTKEFGKGTGLGLSQVYGFAKQAGGEVRIFTVLGHGTTVELLLPCTPRAEMDASATPPAAALVRPRNGEVVLVVEDDMHVRAVVVESLGEMGYATITADTAAAALRALRGTDRIDLLFSDVVMPGGMTGIQLAKEARQVRPGLRILLTSGYTGDDARHGTADVPLLIKPYDRDRLARTLQAVLHG